MEGGEEELQVSVSSHCGDGGESPPAQPPPPYTIDGLRDCASWIASFTAQLEAEKAAVGAEKASVEAKLRELGEREEEFESLGSYIEERAIRVREVEEELEGKRKELEAHGKELERKREKLEECLNRLRIREKEFEKQLAEFEDKQAEFQVRLSELSVRERGIDEKERQCREKEREFEHRADEFGRKEAMLDLRLGELNKKEREIDEMEKGFRDGFVEFEAKQVKFQEALRELKVKEVEIEEKEERFRKKLEELEAKEVSFGEDLCRLGSNERGIKEKEQHSEELQLEVERCPDVLDVREKRLLEQEMDINDEDLDLKEKQQMEKVCIESELTDKNLAESPSLGVTMDGNELQIFLNERSQDLDLMKDEVQTALGLSSDPAKLVLDAMQGFYPPHLKKGDVEFEEAVIRKSCIMLLELLTKMSIEIKPTIRKEAMKLAFHWMTRMKSDGDHFLEVLAFLQLLAAYGLASAFDDDELAIQFGVVAHYSQVRVLLQTLGFADKISGVIHKLLEMKHQAEAAKLVSAFELHTEFPSISSPKDDQDSSLTPLLGNTSAAPTNPSESRTLSSAEHSWSGACADGTHIECPDPTPVTSVNIPAQQPERLNLPAPQADGLNVPAQQPERLNIPDQQTEGLNVSVQDSQKLNTPAKQPERLSDDQVCSSNLHQEVPSPSRSPFVPECLKITGKLFIPVCSKIEHNQLHCREISDALQLASDPAEFVLGIVKNPSSLTLQRGTEAVRLASPRHGQLLLLDLMWRMSPQVKPDVEREALSFAREWRSKFPKRLNYPLEPICFMLFLAAYKLVSHFDQDELFSAFGKGSYWCQNATKLFGLLGFKDLIPKFLLYLMRNNLPLEALHCIKVSSLLESSPSATTALKKYMHACPKKLRGTEGTGQQVELIHKELNVWKAVAESIPDQNLAEGFVDHIAALEEKLQALKNSEAVTGEPPSEPKLSDDQQQLEATAAAEPSPPVPKLSDDQQQQPDKRRHKRQESGAHNKRRRMVEIPNGARRAPPLLKSPQNLRMSQQPAPFTASFRPSPAASTVLYPNPPYGFRVLPFHCYPPPAQYRYPRHGR